MTYAVGQLCIRTMDFSIDPIAYVICSIYSFPVFPYKNSTWTCSKITCDDHACDHVILETYSCGIFVRVSLFCNVKLSQEANFGGLISREKYIPHLFHFFWNWLFWLWAVSLMRIVSLHGHFNTRVDTVNLEGMLCGSSYVETKFYQLTVPRNYGCTFNHNASLI